MELSRGRIKIKKDALNETILLERQDIHISNENCKNSDQTWKFQKMLSGLTLLS